MYAKESRATVGERPVVRDGAARRARRGQGAERSRLRVTAWGGVAVVQQMLGHKSATMTLDVYGHLFQSRLDDVASALDSAAHASVVAQALPAANVVDLDAARQSRTARQTSDIDVVPSARIELATPGLGVRRSIP